MIPSPIPFIVPYRPPIGSNVSNTTRDSPPSYDEVVRNRGHGKEEKKIDKILFAVMAIVLLILVVLKTCMVKDQLKGRENRDFIMKIQDLKSKTYNEGRFYKIVYTWKALEEGDLSLIEGEIVELKPFSVDEKKNGWLYGRSSGQEGRFPNIGGLLEGPIEACYIERVSDIINNTEWFPVHNILLNKGIS